MLHDGQSHTQVGEKEQIKLVSAIVRGEGRAVLAPQVPLHHSTMDENIFYFTLYEAFQHTSTCTREKTSSSAMFVRTLAWMFSIITFSG